jgi:hypothetical protein
MNDEDHLKQKLRAIEALFAGATTAGERDAADRARDRIAARLRELRGDAQVEWQFSLTPWSRRLLIALAKRYGLRPYRYRRQRRTTLVVRAPERFLREVFLPEYDRMFETLCAHLDAVTERVLAEVLNDGGGDNDVAEQDKPKQLEVFAATKGVASK